MSVKESAVFPWLRFEPIGYELNWERIHNIAATVIDEAGTHTVTTVGAVLQEALPGWFHAGDEKELPARGEVPEARSSLGVLRIAAPSRTMRVDGLCEGGHFAAQVVDRVFQILRATDGSEYSPELYYFGHSSGSCEATWWERYNFFVVAGDKIVVEDLEFSSLCTQDIDETVLKPKEYWVDGKWKTPGNDTWLRWCYRQFYSTTRTGQLMVMRSDSPPLFHYVAPERLEVERHGMAVATSKRLARIEFVLVAAVVMWVLRVLFGPK
jgi:hypothetical protein